MLAGSLRSFSRRWRSEFSSAVRRLKDLSCTSKSQLSLHLRVTAVDASGLAALLQQSLAVRVLQGGQRGLVRGRHPRQLLGGRAAREVRLGRQRRHRDLAREHVLPLRVPLLR